MAVAEDQDPLEFLARAPARCPDLPPSPTILDMGCGVGATTLHPAALPPGVVVALDNHAPFLRLLSRAVAERGLPHRVRTIAGRPRAGGFIPDASSVAPCMHGSVGTAPA